MPIHTTRGTRPAAEITRKGKILLFDERAEALKRVGALLAAEGHSVRQCSSFSEAVDRVTDESFDIVVIGQEAGLEEEGEVAEWARAVDSRLPVLMLLTDEKDLPGDGTRWKRDVSEYLRKPVTVVEERELKETVQRHLKPRVTLQIASQNPT
jgi:PleD family two-component response regulator